MVKEWAKTIKPVIAKCSQLFSNFNYLLLWINFKVWMIHAWPTIVSFHVEKENNYWLSQLILVTTLIQEKSSKMKKNIKLCLFPFQVFQIIHFGDCDLTISNIGLQKKKTFGTTCLWCLKPDYFGPLLWYWDRNILWRSLVRNDRYFILCLDYFNLVTLMLEIFYLIYI